MILTYEQAERRLRRMVAASTDPVLEDDEIEDLLLLAMRPDAAGLLPSDALWTPTWNLNKAAVEGWLTKAGKVSDLTTIRTGDLTYEDNTAITHCLDMAEQFRKRLHGSVTLGSGNYDTSDTEVEDEEG